MAALKAGKHVACTVPMGDHDRRVPADRRVAAQERQGLHDDGDRRLQPRVPVRQGALRQRRAGADPVPARHPPAGHGRLARLLGGLAADALRHALRQPLPGASRASRPSSVVCHGSGRIDENRSYQVRQPVRGRDRDVQDCATRTSAPRSPAACSTRPGSTARASTSTATKKSVRVAAGRERRAGHPHEEHARASRSASRRSRSASRCPTTRTCCPSRFADSRSPRRSRTQTICRFFRAAVTAARIRTWSTTFLMACLGPAAGHAGRRDVGQLDDGGDLRAPVGVEGW